MEEQEQERKIIIIRKEPPNDFSNPLSRLRRGLNVITYELSKYLIILLWSFSI